MGISIDCPKFLSTPYYLERISHRGFLGATLGTETFTDLDYADDVTLLSEMLEVLLLALDVLREEASPLGLEVNWQKTKIQSTIDSAALYLLQFWSQLTQLTSLSPMSTSAQKFIPPAAQNLKSTVGSVWPKPASINLIEEYGAPASLSLPKFNYTDYRVYIVTTAFNRSSSNFNRL